MDNDRLRQYLRGVSGERTDLTQMPPRQQVGMPPEADAQSEKIRQLLLQHALQNPPQQDMPVQPPAPRQFNQIQQQLQPNHISSKDIRSMISPTEAITPDQEEELNKTRGQR